MKHSEFRQQLSSRLDIKESEVSTLLRANRKLLKKLVQNDNGFSIPGLGLFKKHPGLKQKEYSHYHGYKLLTKLKKILRFYPDHGLKKNVSERVVSSSDISELLTTDTSISNEVSQLFVNETAAIIKEGLARDKQIFVSGVGLFKTGKIEANDKVKDINYTDAVIYFRADAGLRSNILKSNDPVYASCRPDFNPRKPSAVPVDGNAPERFKSVRRSPASRNDTLPHLSEKSLSTAASVFSKKRPSVVDSMSLERKTGPATITHSPINKASPPEEFLGNTTSFTADNNYQTTLSGKTFQMEEIKPVYNEKHPYFEWFIISIFLIILAGGLYLIKPSPTPQKEFSTQPFAFTKIPEQDKMATSKPASTKDSGDEAHAVQQQTDDIVKETAGIESAPSPDQISRPAGLQYLTISGDSLWEIATDHYSSPYFWPVIYQMNAERLTSPDTLEVGITLELPLFKTLFDTLSPEEKPIVVESYYRVYSAYKELGNADAETYLTVSQNF